MYAVIESGGKQYRVEVGTELEVDLLDVAPGDALTLDRVLLVGDGDETAIGRPLVANASVQAEVVRRDRGSKLIVFKYRPKARRRVKKGHRQDHTVLRITDVRLGSKSAAADVRKAEQAARSERQRLEEAAARQAAEDAALAAKLAKTKTASDDEPASTKPAGRGPMATSTEAPKPAKAEAKPAKAEARPAKAEARPAKGASKTAADRTGTKPKAKAEPGKARAAGARRTTKRAADTRATPKRSRTKKDE